MATREDLLDDARREVEDTHRSDRMDALDVSEDDIRDHYHLDEDADLSDALIDAYLAERDERTAELWHDAMASY